MYLKIRSVLCFIFWPGNIKVDWFIWISEGGKMIKSTSTSNTSPAEPGYVLPLQTV